MPKEIFGISLIWCDIVTDNNLNLVIMDNIDTGNLKYKKTGGKNMFSFLKRDKSETINVNDIDNLIGKVELIDIREPFEYEIGSLKTAKNIPMGDLLNTPNKYLIEENTYYIMCQSGARSSMATRVLSKQGYNVIDVVGGIVSYVGTNRKKSL